MRVAVIGAGRIGAIRAAVARQAGDEVLTIVDIDADRAQAVAKECGATWGGTWQAAIDDSRIEAIVVATVTNAAAEITIAALEAGKHVLHEKPMGRDLSEATRIVAAARRSRGKLKVGFNHRHHPAIARAHEISAGGAIGRILGIRAAYGHGGRPGYEHEWRCDSSIAGGGELVDQGVHLIDLSRWFLGDVARVSAALGTWWWAIEPLEDNAFALLTTADGRIASIHASWTQWRNLFRFEVLGSDGYLTVEGLGRSYGTERLTIGRRRDDWTRPDEEHLEFTGPDVSWKDEWSEFRDAITGRRILTADAEDGYAVSLIVDGIYRAGALGTSVTATLPDQVPSR